MHVKLNLQTKGLSVKNYQKIITSAFERKKSFREKRRKFYRREEKKIKIIPIGEKKKNRVVCDNKECVQRVKVNIYKTLPQQKKTIKCKEKKKLLAKRNDFRYYFQSQGRRTKDLWS